LALQTQSVPGREMALSIPLAPSAVKLGLGQTSTHLMLAQASPPQATVQKPGTATLPSQKTETINYENWILTCRDLWRAPKKGTARCR
jgi:hypothetical protein